ncbi:hypothetical protein IVG45_17370 [Methylomonas sp. LL1]|uniref:hypothetical protein n=1 Tax=Methylomonas sp. LL1 TaxID=2785785 RepID=UPI0018C3F096|nr:hypothetical protein [Methylomonas sp. LL1]QPK62603.1 hypothetical protein IVG45_17370 [Methylomonas sp. LL1]
MNTFQNCMTVILILAAIGQAGASVPLGGNRKGVGGSYDMYGCMQSNDYYVVNFAAYQFDPKQTKDPKNLPSAECIDIPLTGKTQITLDLLDRDVRKKLVSLKILREDGQIIAELPMPIAKQGVVSATVDFKAAGKYQAVLYVNDTDLNIPPETGALTIPLTVALVTEQSGGQGSLLIFFGLIAALIAGLAFFVPRFLKPQQPVNSTP